MIRIGTLEVDEDVPPHVVNEMLRMYGAAGYLLDVKVRGFGEVDPDDWYAAECARMAERAPA